MRLARFTLVIAAVAGIAACGQKGPLYLPDDQGEIITRPGSPQPEAPLPPATQQPDQRPQSSEGEEENADPRR